MSLNILVRIPKVLYDDILARHTWQGVGYPLDIVVCSALGADMYDCVYPTRTARFGTALVPEVGIHLHNLIQSAYLLYKHRYNYSHISLGKQCHTVSN